MNPYNRWPDGAVFYGNDIFRKASPCPRDNDASYLQPGQTEWFGPCPLEGDQANWLGIHRFDMDWQVKEAALKGIHLHIQTVGAYIRTHRLRSGPSKKLSDWKELPSGVPMLLNPCPTPEDVEKALNRVSYMRLNRFGQFRSWTDDAGALWVERLQAAP